MNPTIRKISTAAFLGALLVSTQAVLVAEPVVQSTTTTKTVTSAGTISEFSPQTIVIKSETSSEPVTYRYSSTTTYVDESGTPVSLSVVRSGLPVTVYYTQDGDNMVATKVVVKKTTTTTPGLPAVETKTTTTTTEKEKK